MNTDTVLVDVAVKDLSGAALDWAVAGAVGMCIELTGKYPHALIGGRLEGRYSPSSSWSWGGPLIEKNQVSLHCPQTTDDVWAAWVITDKGEVVQAGDTALTAACRAIAAASLGDIVKVPACLVLP